MFLNRFSRYETGDVKKDWHFKVVGISRFQNSYPTKMRAKYELYEDITQNAEVSAEISLTAETKLAFLSALEAKIDFRGGYSRTWNKGWKATLESTVLPYTVAYITNYQVGVSSKGALVYEKRSPTEALCGEYREIVGGTVLSLTDTNLEITATEPMSH